MTSQENAKLQIVISHEEPRETKQLVVANVQDTLRLLKNQIQFVVQGKISEISITHKANQRSKIDLFRNEEEENSSHCHYEIQLLKEQLLLFDRQEEISNYIETEKILARDALKQLSELCFCLMKLSKELISSQKPMVAYQLKEEHYSKQKLDKIENECMNTLMRVKQERRRIDNCCICLTNKSKAVIFPCMHFVLCTQCASTHLQKCPICNQSIQQIREVYQ